MQLVMGLQRAPDDDFVQLIRDDEIWAQLAEAVAPFVHAGAETARPGLPGGKTYIGLDGFRESWLDWLAPYAEYRTEVEEAIDCGERVLLLQRSSGRLDGSPKEVKLAPAVVYTVRDGKIARFEPYADRAEALRAVGLRAAAMSREQNVELVRRGYEAFNRWAAQPQGAPPIESLFHPEIEFHTYPTSPEVGVYRGRDAVISYNQRLFEQFESTHIELEELLPVGDRVMVVSRQHAVPKAGAEAMVVRVIEVWTIRDDLLAERRTFPTREEALEAVGLRE